MPVTCRITLSPLTVAGTGELMSSMVAGEPVSQEFAAFVQENTGGLPLAVEEVLHLMQRRLQRDGGYPHAEQAPSGERWVRLTWMVAPSASVLALLPPSRRTAEPPKTVLIYTITGDERSAQTNAWCETRIPDKGGGPTSSSLVFREALGDYRQEDITKDTIINSFLASYQRHVLGSEPNW